MMEALFEAFDDRLYKMNLIELAKALELPLEYVFYRPRYKRSEPSGTIHMSAVNVAGLAIYLEHFGFNMLVQPLVNDLLPAIRRLQQLTVAELCIYQYASDRQRTRFLLRSAQQSTPPSHPDEEKRLHTPNGYCVQITTNDSRTQKIEISGPKWKLPKPKVEVNCDICGTSYFSGDPDEEGGHRRYHKQILSVLQPKPERRLLADNAGPSIIRITANSPLWMHQAIYDRARAFKREMGFDFVQWTLTKNLRDRDANADGYLFISPEGTIEGACSFRSEAKENTICWSLDWVWIRPEKRRQGIVESHWPRFLATYGDFWVEHPISDAMMSFLLEHASHQQRIAMEIHASEGIDGR
ncbi:hypothetical protein F506_19800 [Herbaspirillum hiltneri N3]|uniref:N-acetyltransferase ESCO zinc-finger domain-containing protein n=2 Tax=Herbaspirillum TaxID=963 RepID=A0ABM5V581_9BURK|nr:hypothetical protein F506_19800 [Herbaspirillum hiltneri N3]